MRIVMIGDFPRDYQNIGGGVESVMLYLCEALGRNKKVFLEVLTIDRWGLGERVIAESGIKVHYLAASSLPGRFKHFADVRNLREKIVALKPDLVHAHIAGKYSEAARLSGLPWVLTLHGIRFLEAQLRTDWRDRLYKNSLVKKEELGSVRAAEHIISINPFIQEAFGSELKGNIYDIENPVSEDYFKIQPQPQKGRLLYVGRITPRKSVHHLIDAAELAFQSSPDLELRIAGGFDSGKGAQYGLDLKERAERSDHADQIKFLGNLDEAELLEEYRTCAALVLVSELETAPMAITQALASGTPVITTDVGGCRHLVVNRETGFLVPFGDVDKIANAILELFSSRDKCIQWGCQAREFAVKRFRVGAIAEKTVEVYESVLRH